MRQSTGEVRKVLAVRTALILYEKKWVPSNLFPEWDRVEIRLGRYWLQNCIDFLWKKLLVMMNYVLCRKISVPSTFFLEFVDKSPLLQSSCTDDFQPVSGSKLRQYIKKESTFNVKKATSEFKGSFFVTLQSRVSHRFSESLNVINLAIATSYFHACLLRRKRGTIQKKILKRIMMLAVVYWEILWWMGFEFCKINLLHTLLFFLCLGKTQNKELY